MLRLLALSLCTLTILGCGKKDAPSPEPQTPDPAASHRSALLEGGPTERIAAIQALAAMGDQAKSAVPELEKLANHEDEKIRHEAAIALQAIAPENLEGRSGMTLLRLKQIGQAMLKHVDAHNGLFPQTCTVVAPKDAKQMPRPGLSWRVLLLPFLDQKELFAQFKLDEPWDSETNKKLIEKMPAVFAPPKGTSVAVKTGETYSQVITLATLLPNEVRTPVFQHPALICIQKTPACHIHGVIDGTSRTFLVIEASKPIIWTKPEDVVISDAPLPEFGHAVDHLFHVCMADGSVMRFSRFSSAHDLRTAIGRADGMVNNFEAMWPDRVKQPKETTRVLGRVIVKGAPLTTGWVVLHAAGREYGGALGVDGSFLVKDVPLGKVKATITQGDPFAAWMENPNAKFAPFGGKPLVPFHYTNEQQTPLSFDVKPDAKEVMLMIE